MDPVASRHPESDDSSDTDLPPAASPGPAVPDATRGPASQPTPDSTPRHLHRPRRDPGRIRTVPVRLQPGPPGRLRTGDRALGRGRVPAVLGHLPHDQRPVRGRRDRPWRARPGRHQGDDRFARRSLLAVPVGRSVSAEPPDDQRPVRGDRRGSLVAGGGWQPGLRPARGVVPPRDHQVVRRLACRSGRPARRRHRPVGRRGLARWPDGRRRQGQDPRPERERGHPRRPARQRDTRAARHHPRRGPDQRGQQQGSCRRDGRLRVGRRLLGRRGRRGRGRPERTRRSRPEEAHPRPAREPRRLRDRRPQDRQPVHRVRRGLLGAGRGGRPGRHRCALRRGRHEPRHPSWSC